MVDFSAKVGYNFNRQPSQKWQGSKGADNTPEPLTHRSNTSMSANVTMVHPYQFFANLLTLGVWHD